VDVGMSEQVLSPGMEYREESDLGSEMFGFGGYFQKGFGTGAEQEVIEDPLVLQDELGELVGKGEDNMDVGDRQEFVLASRDPFIAGSALAFWAMPIAAANGEIPISCLMESNLYWGVRLQ
jgi:hypothetical protein